MDGTGDWSYDCSIVEQLLRTCQATQMKIEVNGIARNLESPISIEQLLDLLNVNHRAIAVELNSQIQTRPEFSNIKLQDGDRLEIVTLAGGG